MITLFVGMLVCGTDPQVAELNRGFIDIAYAVPINHGFVAATWHGSIVVVRDGTLEKGASKRDGGLDFWSAPQHPLAASVDGGTILIADRKRGLLVVEPPDKVLASEPALQVAEVFSCGSMFWVTSTIGALFHVTLDAKGKLTTKPVSLPGVKVVSATCAGAEVTVLARDNSNQAHVFTVTASGDSASPRVTNTGLMVPAESRLIFSSGHRVVVIDTKEIRCFQGASTPTRTISATVASGAWSMDRFYWTDGAQVFWVSCDGSSPPEIIVPPGNNVASVEARDGNLIWVYPGLGKVMGLAR